MAPSVIIVSEKALMSTSTPRSRTERFELYITGREFGNGFSELNDAEDQTARFAAQVDAKESGDDYTAEASGSTSYSRAW